MVDPAQVQVSDDGQWVYDGYQWWPIALVPPGTTAANGYTWDGRGWMRADNSALKQSKSGWSDRLVIGAVVAFISIVVLAFVLLALIPSILAL